jgi:hypothetical protein
MQRETSLIANRLGDSRSKAYSLAGEIHVSTIVAPMPLDKFEVVKNEAIQAASETADAHIQNWTRFVVGWEEFHRGRQNEARNVARELMQVGRMLSDPRSTGLGLTRSGRSVVRLFRFGEGRCYELWVRNISTMFGCRERGWRVVWGQSAIPGLAGTISVD